MYPRELNLGTEIENKLIMYLDEELTVHQGERGSFVADLKRWQKDYWATPSTKIAKFPFHGAATIIVPLNAIAIEAIHSRVMTMMFGLPQFTSCQAISPQWEVVEKGIERFLDYELIEQMKIYNPLEDCYLEGEKFGSLVGKVGYERRVKTSVREAYGVEEEFDVVVADGATFDCVANARYYMPMHEIDPDKSPWIAEEHTGSWYELEQLERGGLFKKGTVIGTEDKPAKLKAWLKTQANTNTGFSSGDEFTKQQQKLENTEPAFGSKIDWHEVSCAFDTDNTGRQKEIIVHYHQPSRTLMSVRYNWWSDLSRNYIVGQYFKVEHRWRGIGICKMNEQFQREITTQHRQRLDNGLLANMRMIVISKMSGYGPKEPVFPGKMWFVDDMTHINTLQMGEIYTSSFQNEQATLLYAQQRTGVNELMLGMPQVGTPGTATGDLARIQEGNKKYDYIFSNFKRFTSEVIIRVASVIQQFGPRQLRYFETAENGQMVQQFFQMPAEFVRQGLLVNIKAAGVQRNKIVDRQDWQQIAGFVQQYFTNLMMIAEQMGDPQLMQLIVSRAILASNEGMRQILETYDVRNMDRIIVTELENAIHSGATGAAGNNGQGIQTPQNAGQPAGMELLSQIFGGGNQLGPGGA